MVATTALGQGTPDTFLRLRDTPDTYVGQALKFVRVNAAENRLEFAAGAGGGAAWGAITGTLSDQTDLQTALDAKVPTSRTLTIGGTALDLSANRSWTLDTITGLGSNGIVKRTGVNTLGIAASGTDYEVPLTFSQSVSRATNTVTLSGDSASPGNSKYYGTDSGGTKGYFALPSGGASVANPGSQLLGLSAINGSASTAMRSDGAPALDQSIAPTWTGLHTWKYEDAITNTTTDVLTVTHNSSATPGNDFGTAIQLKGNSNNTDDRSMGRIAAAWKTATDASRSAYIDITAADSGGFGSSIPLRIYKSGYITNTTGADGNAQYINSASGFRTGGVAPTSSTFLLSNGSAHITSTYLLPAAVGATTGKIFQVSATDTVSLSTPTWPTAAGTSGYQPTSDATNFVNYPKQLTNSSTASQSSTFASDTYLTGSDVTVAAGDFKAKGQYHCKFDMVKTNAGTQTPIINVRIGTAGTTSDTSRITFTFGAGTGVVDTGSFEVWVNFRTVGSGTSAVVAGICEGKHNLATTGLFNNAASFTIVGTVSGGFDSSTATKIGVSFNGGTSFSGTVTTVQAKLEQ